VQTPLFIWRVTSALDFGVRYFIDLLLVLRIAVVLGGWSMQELLLSVKKALRFLPW
jgi:hypothetical protein